MPSMASIRSTSRTSISFFAIFASSVFGLVPHPDGFRRIRYKGIEPCSPLCVSILTG